MDEDDKEKDEGEEEDDKEKDEDEGEEEDDDLRVDDRKVSPRLRSSVLKICSVLERRDAENK